jgi:hypothetical protein
MRKTTIASLIAALVLSVAAACPTGELEDCDAEDRRNREAECGYVHDKNTKNPVNVNTKKPTVKKPG